MFGSSSLKSAVLPVLLLLLLLALVELPQETHAAEGVASPNEEIPNANQQQQHENDHASSDQEAQHHEQHQNSEQEASATTGNSEQEQDSATDDTDSSSGNEIPRDDYGILLLPNHTHLAKVLRRPPDHDRPHGLLLTLVYTSTAAVPQDAWIQKLRGAMEHVRSWDIMTDIQLSMLDTAATDDNAEGSVEWLSNVGIRTTPYLIFVVARNFFHLVDDEDNDNQPPPPPPPQALYNHAFLLDYIGPLDTAVDIGNTVLQYYYRLFQTTTSPQFIRDLYSSIAPSGSSTSSFQIQPFPHLPQDFGAQIVPRPFSAWTELQDFWHLHWTMWRQLALSVADKPGGVSPKWGAEDYDYIQWLLSLREQHSDKTTISRRTITLLVQCQSVITATSPIVNLYATFAEMSWILASRRDVWFLALQADCPPALQAGQVGAFQFAMDSDESEHEYGHDHDNTSCHINHERNRETRDWKLKTVSPPWLQTIENDVDRLVAAQEELRQFVIGQSTPSVLWYDRWATAPIGFADTYKIHMLLFVNVHPLKDEVDRFDPRLERMVQDFHAVCNQYRNQQQEQTEGTMSNDNVICYLVPSTESRLLTTFDIDMWSPRDIQATTHPMPTTATNSKDSGNTEQQVHEETIAGDEATVQSFPTLLVTDRRPQQHVYRDGIITTTHGVRRYLLRPPDIFQDDAVPTFVQDFWNQQLIPELRSSRRAEEDSTVNSYGVRTLTGLEFQQRFQTMATSTEHALVVFTSPSCGHCKRFHNIWNEVSKLLQDLRWDQHMVLYKLDVSQNEVHNMSLPWLPDVYYFPPIATTEEESSLPVAPVRYDRTDEFKNGVGRISDPLDIIEWWLEAMTVEGDWMDPEILIDILDAKVEDVTVEEKET